MFNLSRQYFFIYIIYLVFFSEDILLGKTKTGGAGDRKNLNLVITAVPHRKTTRATAAVTDGLNTSISPKKAKNACVVAIQKCQTATALFPEHSSSF